MPARTRTAAVSSPHHQAEKHLAQRDARLRELIRKVGTCTFRHDPDHFRVLIGTIISQQISTKAADSIRAKLETAAGGLTLAGVAALSDADIRGCGLSTGKLRAVRDLCVKFADGTLPRAGWDALDDAAVRERLITVRGIGPWSVDMFLMFSLGRPDVLPVGDFGLRAGVQDIYELDALPTAAQLHEIAEPWRPYRSVATWYFWRSRGFAPQS